MAIQAGVKVAPAARVGRGVVLPRVWCGGGAWAWGVVGFGYTARPPPPVVLPGAAGASLRLAGALRRASPFGLALPPAVLWRVDRSVSPYGGARQSAIWADRRRASDNRQDSNHRRLARAPRRGLRGHSPQVHPTTFASRAVRRSPVSRFFPRPGRYSSVLIFRSRSCSGSTREGAEVIRSLARCVFGNAITSRIDSVSAASMATLSIPNAMPPCGGAP